MPPTATRRRVRVARRTGLGIAVVIIALVAAMTALPQSGGGTSHPGTAPTAPTSAAAAQLRLPVQDQFVTRTGSTLQLAGQSWRFAGVNMYWLGLDENITDAHGPTYPTHAAVDSAFRAARALGVTVVRSNTLGISVGSPRSLEPSLGHFNERAFRSIDYAVADARRFGLRLMIPLVDEWHYYEGGRHTFTNWAGFTDVPGKSAAASPRQRANEEEFYTDPKVIASFHAYVAHLMDHRNPLTGLKLGADPTIAIWETGNELWDAPASWTEQTAAFIKQHAPNSLVADGSDSNRVPLSHTGYADPDVDIVDGHMYPVDIARATAAAAFFAAHGKAYVIGEYSLPGSGTPAWLNAVAADKQIAGDAAWSMFPWLPDGRPEQHHDGHTFHYPGTTPGEAARDVLLKKHAAAMASPVGTG